MKEYIEREAVCNDCNNLKICVDKSLCPVGRAPAADVVERKRGEWEYIGQTFRNGGYRDEYGCPFCDYEVAVQIGAQLPNFCPHCGNDLREVDHAD